LGAEPRSGTDYLLEDEEETSSSHWRLYLALVILLVAGVLIWARWRQYGYPWDQPGAPPRQAAANQAPPPAEGTSSPSASPAASPASAGGDHAAAIQDIKEPTPTVPAAPPPAREEHASPVPPAAAAQTADAAPAPEASVPAPKPDTETPRPAPPKTQPKPAPAAPAVSSSAGDSLAAEGEKYLYGNGVPQDCDRAIRTLTKAAAKSNPKAQTLMGAMYATGHCATRDLPSAYRWFAKALHNDPSNVRLERDLQMVWNQMTPGERQMATRSE